MQRTLSIIGWIGTAIVAVAVAVRVLNWVGALAIGNVKYQTEAGLFRRMLEADQPLVLDFRDAYELAVRIAG